MFWTFLGQPWGLLLPALCPELTWACHLQDAKVVDNACLALSRIAEAFAHRPASLNMLCEFGLITNAVQLVGPLPFV